MYFREQRTLPRTNSREQRTLPRTTNCELGTVTRTLRFNSVHLCQELDCQGSQVELVAVGDCTRELPQLLMASLARPALDTSKSVVHRLWHIGHVPVVDTPIFKLVLLVSSCHRNQIPLPSIHSRCRNSSGRALFVHFRSFSHTHSQASMLSSARKVSVMFSVLCSL
jgi:hypothetical protein